MEFRVLGGMAAEHAGRAVELGRRQERCLLGLLLLEAGRVVTMDRLVDLLWPVEPPAASRATLHTYAARLRSKLSPFGIPVTARDGGYAVGVDAYQVDVHRFRAEVERARDIADPAARVEVLAAALGLWRGPVLAGVADDALAVRLGRPFEELRFEALELHADAALAAGCHETLVVSLTALLEQQPTRERLVGSLMTALYRNGRQADALDLYRRTRAILADELGLDPSAELQSLHRRVLAGDPDLAFRAPTGRTTARRFLPRDIPDFAGRQAELDELDRRLSGPAGPAMIVITAIAGTAGVGKTALAVRWARRSASLFPDGQLYVDLRGFDNRAPMSAREALSHLLAQLEVAPERVPAGLDQAAALFRGLVADRKLLLVLDNAAAAEQVRPLLPGTPDCVVLVTSRTVLGGLVAREGAARLTLDVLPAETSAELLAAILGADRAEAEPLAVQRLGEICGHLPLALRIAAANLVAEPGRSVADYVASLGEAVRIGALAVADDPASAVRTIFDQSYGALSAERRRAFRLLGLIPGDDFDVAAVAALTGRPAADAAQALAGLLDAHLIVAKDADRYAMHDLVRLYAREQVAAPEAAEPLHAWYAYYAAVARSAVEVVSPQTTRLPAPAGERSSEVRFADSSAALAWLVVEQPNLAAAVAYADRAGLSSFAWSIADTLRGYFWIRRDLHAWTAMAETGLAAATSAASTTGQAAMHVSLGVARRAAGDLDGSIEHLTAALAYARACAWAECEATVVGSLGIAHAETGNGPAAFAAFDEAVAINRRLGRVGPLAVQLGNAAGLRRRLGELRRAEGDLAEALTVYRASGNRAGEAVTLTNLAMTRHELGDAAGAAELLAEALAGHRELDDRYGEAIASTALGRLSLDAGDLDDAAARLAAAVELAGQTGDVQHEAAATGLLAMVALGSGDPGTAADRMERALALPGVDGHTYLYADLLDEHARVLLAGGRVAEAAERATAALNLARADGYAVIETHARTTLAEIRLRAGDPVAAAAEAELARELVEHTGYARCTQRVEAVLAGTAYPAGSSGRGSDHPPLVRVHHRVDTVA
ncbi:AfsR/SARP family transcriptional regulator [Hamadaea tsunoensis]|uniref:AfsR/SARP family transcriptional regulator n=1 Tax=Hamadaea tsunoensis TaxID=53368 RepID=UPI00068525D3|nr:BTAD domain-containing putative transcriptional regulator [Hamadaea tsunoensis]